MKSAFWGRFSVLTVVLLALAAPAQARQSAAAPPAPAETAAPAKTGSLPSTVSIGDVVVSHMTAESSHGHIDVFFSIKNVGKSDERITGAGSTIWDLGDVVQVKKDKDGKEVESPVAINVPVDKTVELSDSDTWLRVKSVNTKPKEDTVLPLTLYFRHSPNADLKIAMNSAGSKGITGTISSWFSK